MQDRGLRGRGSTEDDGHRDRLRPGGQGSALQRRRLRAEQRGRTDQRRRRVRDVRDAGLGKPRGVRAHESERAVRDGGRAGRHGRSARHPDRQVAPRNHDARGQALPGQPLRRSADLPSSAKPERRSHPENRDDHGRGRQPRMSAPPHRRRRDRVHEPRRCRAHQSLQRSLRGERLRRRRVFVRDGRHHPERLRVALGQRRQPAEVRHRLHVVHRQPVGRPRQDDRAQAGAQGLRRFGRARVHRALPLLLAARRRRGPGDRGHSQVPDDSIPHRRDVGHAREPGHRRGHRLGIGRRLQHRHHVSEGQRFRRLARERRRDPDARHHQPAST